MTTTFADLGVPEAIVAALAERGITEPFPIQAATIPPALEGRDLSGKAPTGSGKTIAFGIPMVAGVTRSAPKRPHGLVLAPTRELAIQVADELGLFAGELRVLAVYGGADIERQIKRLRGGVDIVVATPGRLIDLIDRKVCDLRDVQVAVVDEADRMADMGFLPDVKRLLDQARPDRQTILFSATLDGAIDELVQRYQHDPVVHEVEEEQAGDVVHHVWLVERPKRSELVAAIAERVGPTVVFCRTKHGADRVAQQLEKAGVAAVAIHGNRSQAQRERALDAFHRGKVRALVATDVAARGIHVEGVMAVVHYDLPADAKDFVHRSGRTGRAGGDGTVITLIDAKQRKEAVRIKKAAGVAVEIGAADLELLPVGPRPHEVRANAEAHDERRGRSRKDDRGPKGGRGRPSGAKGERKDGHKPSHKGERKDGRKAGHKDGHKASHKDGHKGSHDAGRAPERTDERAPAARRDGRPSTRPERSDRQDDRRDDRRPAARSAHRSDRSDDRRSDRWDDDRGGRNDERRPNRAERRKAQFSDEERARRAEANQRAELQRERNRAGARTDGRSGGRPGPRSSGRGAPGEPDRTLPGDLPGQTDKVRPSGASRRKAKREADRAAGVEPTRAKSRRSGKPRPPKSVRQAARG